MVPHSLIPYEPTVSHVKSHGPLAHLSTVGPLGEVSQYPFLEIQRTLFRV